MISPIFVQRIVFQKQQKHCLFKTFKNNYLLASKILPRAFCNRKAFFITVDHVFDEIFNRNINL